jgi:hypothetical protein
MLPRKQKSTKYNYYTYISIRINTETKSRVGIIIIYLQVDGSVSEGLTSQDDAGQGPSTTLSFGRIWTGTFRFIAFFHNKIEVYRVNY